MDVQLRERSSRRGVFWNRISSPVWEWSGVGEVSMDKWSRRRCGYGVDVSRGRERMWSEADWKGIVVSGTNLRQGSLAERSFEGRFGRGIVLGEDVIRRARPRIAFHVPGGY